MKQLVGSFQNRLMEMGTRGQPTPVVGMGVTELCYSDRTPYQITRTEEKGGKVKKFWMRSCEVIHDAKDRNYGVGGDINEDGYEVECRQNRREQWCVVENKYRNDGTKYRGITGRIVRLESDGRPGQYYYDPHF